MRRGEVHCQKTYCGGLFKIEQSQNRPSVQFLPIRRADAVSPVACVSLQMVFPAKLGSGAANRRGKFFVRLPGILFLLVYYRLGRFHPWYLSGGQNCCPGIVRGFFLRRSRPRLPGEH
jgi:hypothetical protein